MSNTQLHQSPSASPTLVPLTKPSSQGNGGIATLLVQSTPALQKSPRSVLVGVASSNIKVVASPIAVEKSLSVKAVVIVKPKIGGFFSHIAISRGLDKITDLVGKTILLELVSAALDPKTGQEKKTTKGYVRETSQNEEGVTYECEFVVGEEFGEVGAIFVENEHHEEMYIKDIILDGLESGPLSITCKSWVHSKYDNPQKRVFFTNKCYLPSETPSGLRRLREEELVILRGNGQGERKSYERIYDYDVYNDLGNSDSDADKKRPVLGGQELPYPRRCRTGRRQCKTDPLSESRSRSIYVPRDEQFSTIKNSTFSAKTVYSVMHALLPSLETAIVDANLGFPFFTAIDKLFNEGVNLPPLQKQGFLKDLFPRLVKTITDASQDLLRFETPETMNRNRFFWFSDEEFARQTLAGINPCTIQLITEWPLRSELDPTIYGPSESAITIDIIEREIKGFMTVNEAIKQKKLFMLDYHDLFLPYVNKVRQLKGTTLYGSRTIFFLTPDNTLKSLAIELTRPPTDDGRPQWKQVFTPPCHSTGMWLWRLAKAHVLAHDSGYHQLVSHWLRTHCATEPYIIATNRQLSEMHPIYKLLHPHFRYTMEINALARGNLINGDGIIESTFSPGKYSMELSAVAYDKQWQFDLQGLPNDLISRGLAVEDPTAPHGLKLAIEDYPFANDGLLLWDAIKEWVTDYVNHYYPDPSRVASDNELQSWWTEIRTVGHGDKKDSPGWPDLRSPSDLIHIITTMVWVTSGHHAAVNFGQYTYGGYFPNRPTIARTKMPVEDPSEEELKIFMDKPEVALLKCFPSQIQATKVMAVLDVLSNHSPDEEYLGQDPEPAWKEEPVVNTAFERFNGRLKELEGIIDARNNDQRFKNRSGAGIVPYELLKPFSEPGVTGKGVPYSISI
ncbi:linoleate 13S-lipoxygenase 2-1, chloroplastic-like [Rhodamnia argentea]|uniref:Lipoxygenase n=1 Tax=Rhodamnia argentea TaxID=178133 RepID=A0ABM3HVG5_9MYRT|nr:linoleate 13S-lipoxygenase 2-1, chloroplastic-like [Rhodamnia argentea]